MRVVISAPAKYHFFDLGRQLLERGMLTALMTGYPKSKLRDEGELFKLIHSFPYFHLIYRAVAATVGRELDYPDRKVFDWLVSKNLPPCDVFMGIAASCLESARVARAQGAAVIVDRPCSHIVVQDRMIQEEAKKEGIKLRPIDPRVIELELQEYEFADFVTVPSNFAYKSFIEQGFPKEKLRIVPYGIDLERFRSVGQPTDGNFEVLYVGLSSVRKGTPHLLRAFERLKHPKKHLTIIGDVRVELKSVVRDHMERSPITLMGHIPQVQLKEHMSKCHVFVLPSVEDGYGLVMSQAMACGSPVIATSNTGADMVITDGVEGFIIAASDDDQLTTRLQQLADDPSLRNRMAEAAGAKAKQMADWSSYGDGVVAMFHELRG